MSQIALAEKSLLPGDDRLASAFPASGVHELQMTSLHVGEDRCEQRASERHLAPCGAAKTTGRGCSFLLWLSAERTHACINHPSIAEI